MRQTLVYEPKRFNRVGIKFRSKAYVSENKKPCNNSVIRLNIKIKTAKSRKKQSNPAKYRGFLMSLCCTSSKILINREWREKPGWQRRAVIGFLEDENIPNQKKEKETGGIRFSFSFLFMLLRLLNGKTGR